MHSAARTIGDTVPVRRELLLVLAGLMSAGCGQTVEGAARSAATTTSTPPMPQATWSTTVRSTTTRPPPAQPPTTVGSVTSTTLGATTSPATTAPTPPAPFAMLDEVVGRLAAANTAVSVSAWRDGAPLYRRAEGSTVAGAPATTATPFVQASVSKVLTSLTVVRLAERGLLELSQPVPWSAMGFDTDRAWRDVTVRDLITHESGMPIAPDVWFDERGSCSLSLAPLLAAPPTARRGEWTYSNGNYCALGLLIENLTGARYDTATRDLVLAPAGVMSAHLTVDGLAPTDAPYPLGVERLDRLGAAGQWIVATDDVAAVLSTVTPRDRRALRGPGLLRDMLGWGHTGTIDGAKSCAWVLDAGRTVVVATVAGHRPARGSLLCVEVIPAVLADLATS
jgi:CubicO group peptidase (beta-lactamase class C family)